ncbi:MAG: hypothetical protein K2O89_04985 [Clostridia bacterium]|nr:hypothetical protein [Clostridia bacterium]
MSENFKKLKTKNLIIAIIKSVIVGVAAGLAAAGIVMICMKLCVTAIDSGYYFLIGFATAAVAGCGAFLALRSSDKKLAKRIDEDYSLQERVQTMLEFAGKEGEIVEMQRADTSARIAGLPVLKSTYIRFIAPVVSLILACAVFGTAAVLPADAGSVFDPGNDKYTATETQLMALDTLITDVENSSVGASLKKELGNALGDFRTALDDVTVYGAKAAFAETVYKIDDAVIDANSYKTVCPELVKYPRTALLAKAFNDSVTTYQSRNVRISAYAQVENLSVLTEEAVGSVIKKEVDALRAKLNVLKNSTTASLAGELNDTVNCFDRTLAASQKYAEDGFYTALKDFGDKLKEIAENVDSYTDDYMQNTFDALSDALVTASAEALHAQAFNRMTQDFVRNRLADIFTDLHSGLPELDDSLTIPAGSNVPSENDPGGEGGDNDDDGDHTGSGGDQEIDFGSDDKIFNPFTGEYVSYLELLDFYQNLLSNKMNGGNLSPELIKFFEDYFSSLTESKSNG